MEANIMYDLYFRRFSPIFCETICVFRAGQCYDHYFGRFSAKQSVVFMYIGQFYDHLWVFLSPSFPKISYPIEGTVTRTDVAFYFMLGAEQWYKYQSWLLWHPFNLTKLFDSLV
jgi:hypothetical protein